MAWFLALQGAPSKGGQSLTYELHETADTDQLARDMSAGVVADRVVEVPAVLPPRRQQVTLYVRPAVWGVWAFYEMSEDERREMIASNPLINAVTQAAKQQQQGRKSAPTTIGMTIPQPGQNPPGQ
ncbi:hypothetical protein H7J77_05130 [Mycolicibacillus parakoreensis]|uniref:Uncharacterized protein n=1 Tax=Mycolicibacillus parakoreensis TaxID=1069221 RepID=A0ABY3U332_9MYCO|nr:hypothetical protein [Mycolicibacillus parakoreensis]MCV7314921.1 hypothetical protein [Mycolicibacillus parakoreensis]ULN53913.1 hypothetical protein MIU77_06355 [Mycolicibacillus parakoreensis]HLR99533.1 hypothetical protein [Mycolicibacillus parakoreensis]